MSCCFYACHWSGKLIQKTKSSADWRKIIKRASFHLTNGYAGYHLPYHKTDPFYHGTDILFSPQDTADPVSLLKHYVIARDRRHGACSALFLRQDGSIPTHSWFDSKLFSFVDKSFGRHSPRAGGATYYASLGLPSEIIMAIGRWTSEAWKTYIRNNPCVWAAMQLANSRSLNHI